MGFLGELVKGISKVVITPLAIVNDVINDDNKTGELIEGIIENTDNGVEDLLNGDLI